MRDEDGKETLYLSSGVLKYHSEPTNLRLEVDPELVKYYRKLMPRSIWSRPQMYPAHISIVRKEKPKNIAEWSKREGQIIEFLYSNIVQFNETYCWLNCFSKELELVRIELGLPVDSIYTRPPDGYSKCFHCSIGNFKKKEV